MPEVKAGYWWAREKHGISRLQIIEVAEDLKNCWAIGVDDVFDLNQWELLKPVPEYKND